jgi:hypothetical protein
MKVKLLGVVKRGGIDHQIGETLELPSEDAEILFSYKVAEEIKEKAPKAPKVPKAPKAPKEPKEKKAKSGKYAEPTNEPTVDTPGEPQV